LKHSNSTLVPSDLRTSLGTGKPTIVLQHDALRYRGRGPDGRRVELDWLVDARLPARYEIGDRRNGELLTLESIERADTAGAFTTLATCARSMLQIWATDSQGCTTCRCWRPPASTGSRRTTRSVARPSIVAIIGAAGEFHVAVSRVELR
jgi:hypothetical protein